MNPSPPTKPKLSAVEVRVRRAVRLQAVRLQIAIYCELDGHGITTTKGIAGALGIPAAEATALLNRKHFHEGDLAHLEAAAAQLGL